MTTPQPDAALEAEINYAAMRLATAPTPLERRAWWNALTQLHEQRSEERVREMERAQKLTRTAHG